VCEQSLATDPASIADKTAPILDLHTIHFAVECGSMDAVTGRFTEAWGLTHALHTSMQFLGYAGTTSLEILRSSMLPTFPVIRIITDYRGSSWILEDIITRRRNYSATPWDRAPAHRTLSHAATARTGSSSNPVWRRRPCRYSCIQQIADSTRYTLQHPCRMVYGSPPWTLRFDATELRCLRDLMMMMMMVVVVVVNVDT